MSDGLRQRHSAMAGEPPSGGDAINVVATDGDAANQRPETLADEIRARMEARKLERDRGIPNPYNAPLQGPGFGGFTFFSKFDLVLFLVLFFALWVWVKNEHKIDIAKEAWKYIGPSYDEGHWEPAEEM